MYCGKNLCATSRLHALISRARVECLAGNIFKVTSCHTRRESTSRVAHELADPPSKETETSEREISHNNNSQQGPRLLVKDLFDDKAENSKQQKAHNDNSHQAPRLLVKDLYSKPDSSKQKKANNHNSQQAPRLLVKDLFDNEADNFKQRKADNDGSQQAPRLLVKDLFDNEADNSKQQKADNDGSQQAPRLLVKDLFDNEADDSKQQKAHNGHFQRAPHLLAKDMYDTHTHLLEKNKSKDDISMNTKEQKSKFQVSDLYPEKHQPKLESANEDKVLKSKFQVADLFQESAVADNNQPKFQVADSLRETPEQKLNSAQFVHSDKRVDEKSKSNFEVNLFDMVQKELSNETQQKVTPVHQTQKGKEHLKFGQNEKSLVNQSQQKLSPQSTVSHQEKSTRNESKVKGQMQRDLKLDTQIISNKIDADSGGNTNYEIPEEKKVPVSCIRVLDNILKDLNLLAVAEGFAEIRTLILMNRSDMASKKVEVESSAQFQQIVTYISKLLNSDQELDLSQIAGITETILVVTKEDLPVLNQLNEFLLEKWNRLSLSGLTRLGTCYRLNNSTVSRHQMYEKFKLAISKRWVEIDYVTTNKEVISLLNFDFEKGNIVEKVEEKCLDIVPRLSPEQLLKVFKILYQKRSRSIPLLKSIMHHLNQLTLQKIPVDGYIDLLRGCCDLSLFEPSFLWDISACLLKIPENITSKNIISAITSLSRLHFNDPEVITSLLSILAERNEKLSPTHVSDLTRSFATFGFSLGKDAAFLQGLVKSCIDVKESNPETWLSMVSSMVVLKLADEEMVSSVLDESFYDILMADIGTKNFKITAAIQKLLSVDVAAQFEIEGYKGHRLKQNLPLQIQDFPVKDKTLLSTVSKAIDIFAPSGKYTQSRRLSTLGRYVIDAELFVDKIGRPVPYAEAKRRRYIPALDGPNDDTHHRIAIRILGFHDMLIPNHRPLGQNLMAVRHLQKMGYKVVEVPFNEWANIMTPVAKVQYIEKKIQDAISSYRG